MARNADIRLYLVKSFPYMNIRTLLQYARAIRKEISYGFAFSDNSDLPKKIYVDPKIKHMGDFVYQIFNLRTPTKFTNELGDQEFTIASLDAFIDELTVLTHVRQLGDVKFGSVVIPPDDDIMYSFSNDEDMYNIFSAELFSCLTRRFQNRGRRGCNNDYHFELKFPHDIHEVNISVKDIVFEDDRIHYRLFVDTEIMHNALAGKRVFVPPVIDGVDIQKEKLVPVITLNTKPVVVIPRNEVELEFPEPEPIPEKEKVGFWRSLMSRFM